MKEKHTAVQIRCPKTTQANHLCGMSVFVYWWLRQPGLQRITAWYTRLPRKAISLTSHAGLFFRVCIVRHARRAKLCMPGVIITISFPSLHGLARSNAFYTKSASVRSRHEPYRQYKSPCTLSHILCFFQTGRLRFAFLGCTHPHKWT